MEDNQKRKNTRIKKIIKVKINHNYIDLANSLTLNCFSKDLSIGGMKLEVNTEYNLGDLIFIRFLVNDINFIDIQGSVKWQKERIPGKSYFMGIEFEKLDKTKYEKLEQSLGLQSNSDHN